MKCYRDVRRAHTDLFARCGCPHRRSQEAARSPRDWHSSVAPLFREEMVQKTMLQHPDREREVTAKRCEEEAFWQADSLDIYMMLIAEKTGQFSQR